MEYVSRSVLAALYTGSNASELLTMCQTVSQYTGNTWSIDSEANGTLVLKEAGTTGQVAYWPVATGQVVVVAPDFGIINRMSPAAYNARYRALDAIISAAVVANLPVIAASQPVQDTIKAEVARAMYGGFGTATLPLLIVGATSAPIPVTIKPVQPDTGYVAQAFAISGAAVLTTLEVISVTKTSGSVVTVVVRNNGLASVSGILLVHITQPVGPQVPSKS